MDITSLSYRHVHAFFDRSQTKNSLPIEKVLLSQLVLFMQFGESTGDSPLNNEPFGLIKQ